MAKEPKHRNGGSVVASTIKTLRMVHIKKKKKILKKEKRLFCLLSLRAEYTEVPLVIAGMTDSVSRKQRLQF